MTQIDPLPPFSTRTFSHVTPQFFGDAENPQVHQNFQPNWGLSKSASHKQHDGSMTDPWKMVYLPTNLPYKSTIHGSVNMQTSYKDPVGCMRVASNVSSSPSI